VERSKSHVDVTIDADDIVRADTVRVEVEVEVQPRSGAGWTNAERRTFRPDPREIAWPLKFELMLEPEAVVPSFSLVATAFDRQGAIVARAQTIREPKRALDAGLGVSFESACYRQSRVCTDGETCSGGACVNARDDRPLEPTGDGRTSTATSADTAASDAPGSASGLANEGEACSGELRACASHATMRPLKCDGGVWRADAQCAEDHRCDTSPGVMRGTCRPIARECTNQKPDVAFCDGDTMRVCRDLVSSEVRPCPDNQHCVPGTSEAQCACSPGFVADGSLCRQPSDCDRDNGGCDKLTMCSVVPTGRACSVCPPGYSGSGEAGCAPLLQMLLADRLAVTPDVAPDVFSYRVHAAIVTPVVTLTAAGPDLGATHIAFDSVQVEEGQAWSSPKLPLGESHVELTLTSESGASNTYEVTIERTGKQSAFIKASNTGAGDYLGASVAVHGDTLAAGAPFEDSAATGLNGDQSNNGASTAGAVYVYRRSDKGWAQEAYLKPADTQANDNFGISVGLEGDTLVVGAPHSGFSEAYQPTANAGVAYVFTRVNGTWSQVQKLVPSKSVGGDMFGIANAIQGDTLAIGATGGAAPSGEHSGVVYVFERSGNMWVERQILAPAQPPGIGGFGGSVALSGDRLLTGAPWESPLRRGSAFAFARRNGSWGDEQRLAPETLGDGATFGFRVGMYGDRLAVGAPQLPYNATLLGPRPAGEAYIYELVADRWQQTGLVRSQAPEDSDEFGICVAVTAASVLVGAEAESGSARGINGDPLRKGSSEAGAVYEYAKLGGQWVYSDYLKAGNASANDHFGWGLAVSGDMLVVSAPTEATDATGIDPSGTDGATESGALYLFE
jgi:hypothetical protein